MHTSLRAASITLREYLRAGLAADPALGALFGGTPTMTVSLLSPREMAEGHAQGLSVWLYRVVRDEQRLNAPPARIAPDQLQPTPLPVRLCYLVTPIIPNTSSASGPGQAGTEREQEVLGKVMQLLYDRPTLRGPDLEDDLRGTAAMLTVRLEAQSLDDMARVWSALQQPYELSASYELTVAYVAPRAQPSQVAPVRVALPTYATVVGRETP